MSIRLDNWGTLPQTSGPTGNKSERPRNASITVNEVNELSRCRRKKKVAKAGPLIFVLSLSKGLSCVEPNLKFCTKEKRNGNAQNQIQLGNNGQLQEERK